MEHAQTINANAHCQEHIPQLAHGGIRDHALDIILKHCHRPGEDRRDNSNPGNKIHSIGSQFI